MAFINTKSNNVLVVSCKVLQAVAALASMVSVKHLFKNFVNKKGMENTNNIQIQACKALDSILSGNILKFSANSNIYLSLRYNELRFCSGLAINREFLLINSDFHTEYKHNFQDNLLIHN